MELDLMNSVKNKSGFKAKNIEDKEPEFLEDDLEKEVEEEKRKLNYEEDKETKEIKEKEDDKTIKEVDQGIVEKDNYAKIEDSCVVSIKPLIEEDYIFTGVILDTKGKLKDRVEACCIENEINTCTEDMIGLTKQHTDVNDHTVYRLKDHLVYSNRERQINITKYEKIKNEIEEKLTSGNNYSGTIVELVEDGNYVMMLNEYQLRKLFGYFSDFNCKVRALMESDDVTDYVLEVE